MRYILAILSLTLAASAPAANIHPPGDWVVTDFGAIGDGKTLDTDAIQRAIDACEAAGGGVVRVPTGRFLSGTIELKSRIALHLDPGAVLLASTRLADYREKHLVVARGADDVIIEGAGTIDGQGDAFFDAAMNPLPRPSPLIDLENCRGVRLENIRIFHAPGWTLHPRNCDDVKILGISLINNLRAVNTDGIDIDSDRNVVIADCRIEAGDDCIVLKTTAREGGPATAVAPVENVVVNNCVLTSAASALKLGTESHGDFRHCIFSNCIIRESRTGIALLAKDGGTMQDVHFSNITMTTAPKWGQGLEWPIVVDLEKRTAESRLGSIADVSFSHVAIYTKGRIMISGHPSRPLENIRFEDISIRVTGYEEIKAAKKMRGGAHGSADDAPDYASRPAAIIADYIHGLAVDNVHVQWPAATGAATPPLRYLLYTDQNRQLTLGKLSGGSSQPGAPATLLENSDLSSP